MKQRRQKAPSSKLPISVQAQVVKTLNDNHKDELVYIARHYGERKTAFSARIVDLDSNGFTLVWKYKPTDDGDGGNSEDQEKAHDEEMLFAFRTQAKNSEDVLQSIGSLAEDARKALKVSEGTKLPVRPEDRAKYSGNSTTTTTKGGKQAFELVDFTFQPPNPIAAILVIVGMIGCTYTIYATNNSMYKDAEEPYFIKLLSPLATPLTLRLISIYAWVVHLIEASLATALCTLIHVVSPKQMPKDTAVRWVLGTLAFGIFCFHGLWTRIGQQFQKLDG
ncbi:hypothetical protein H4219_004948 [Mycoemilia scoparia]|uniref:DUF2470 domain-containing protein n=1 Tax=Mycoemilia scoparia TaxID=417184 RepID=A0A9W7ZVL1_9FUNG|nr:hypothetical protein H4219_004948 [Mycoemilia scoparia]